MKKITLALLLLSSFSILFAQAPQKMSYQSVIRKTDGTLVVNTLVSIKSSILLGSASGTASYVETQTTTTNNNGLATIEIGGGTPVTGTFEGVDWGAGSHFIKTEIDPAGGSNYTISGTSQLLSVPYALYAGSSKNQGKTSIVITGDITDAEATVKIATEYGPNTENVYVINTTNLTTLDLSVVKSLIDINISDNLKLVSINLNGLTEVYNDLSIGNNEKLNTILFPVLKTVNGDSHIIGNSSLQSISLPLLTKAQVIFFRNNSILSSIDMPLLASLYRLGSISFDKNALSSSQVNLILSRILNITPATGKNINIGGQIPPAPPTGQGIVNKTTLINTGNNVITD
ncbi:hypothetical protein DMB65_19785 [Flavobacterium cheongpyeongense]|uniref:Leucine-rich repeat domain-containing protein n=1 Tax=Flavobacterium cheongpyeongense TaxID=2212651 RepID=A0A2V4BKF1_9FLAO|nr:hypothetical protein [Flavobacterium cheongpyeongense]PXY39012.1 hypothetical protein DMB65_19785 [Flavobacterium cheongpyeongense]